VTTCELCDELQIIAVLTDVQHLELRAECCSLSRYSKDRLFDRKQAVWDMMKVRMKWIQPLAGKRNER
jgi:hypothetical protein